MASRCSCTVAKLETPRALAISCKVGEYPLFWIYCATKSKICLCLLYKVTGINIIYPKQTQMSSLFKIKSGFLPTGDQPQAVTKIVSGLKAKQPHQVLLGGTGSPQPLSHAQRFCRLRPPHSGGVSQ